MIKKLGDNLVILFMISFISFICFMIIEDVDLHPKKLKEAINKKESLICYENGLYKEVKTYKVYEKYITDSDKNKTYLKNGCEPLM